MPYAAIGVPIQRTYMKTKKKAAKSSTLLDIPPIEELDQEMIEKFEGLWSNKEFRSNSLGERYVTQAYHCLGCSPGESIVDYGCGTGRAAKKFALKGLNVTALDIAKNCLDPKIQEDPKDSNKELFVFKQGNIWNFKGMYVGGDYAFVANVLEHLPEEKIESALVNIETHTSKAVYLVIATYPEMRLDKELHLTVKPEYWWKQLLINYFPSASYEVNAGRIHMYWRKNVES